MQVKMATIHQYLALTKCGFARQQSGEVCASEASTGAQLPSAALSVDAVGGQDRVAIFITVDDVDAAIILTFHISFF